MLIAARTIVREKNDEPYCSCPSSPCVESESSVLVTRRMSFFEVHSVQIMMTPAMSRIVMLAGTFSLSAPIRMEVSPAARATL